MLVVHRGDKQGADSVKAHLALYFLSFSGFTETKWPSFTRSNLHGKVPLTCFCLPRKSRSFHFLKSMRESPSPSWTFSCSFYVKAIVSLGYWFFSSSSNIHSFPGTPHNRGLLKAESISRPFLCLVFPSLLNGEHPALRGRKSPLVCVLGLGWVSLRKTSFRALEVKFECFLKNT